MPGSGQLAVPSPLVIGGQKTTQSGVDFQQGEIALFAAKQTNLFTLTVPRSLSDRKLFVYLQSVGSGSLTIEWLCRCRAIFIRDNQPIGSVPVSIGYGGARIANPPQVAESQVSIATSSANGPVVTNGIVVQVCNPTFGSPTLLLAPQEFPNLEIDAIRFDCDAIVNSSQNFLFAACLSYNSR